MKKLALYYLTKYSALLAGIVGVAVFLFFLTLEPAAIHGRRSGILIFFVSVLGLELAALLIAAIIGGLTYLGLSELPAPDKPIDDSK